ncbi:hypothetical protein [Pseudomonas sp. MBLB4136]|uniref:hypothetical protein n=1 Tax=Pseudomonas sp. MBLB4136 TaxID=3451558 RepID=UPI003F74D53C
MVEIGHGLLPLILIGCGYLWVMAAFWSGSGVREIMIFVVAGEEKAACTANSGPAGQKTVAIGFLVSGEMIKRASPTARRALSLKNKSPGTGPGLWRC